MKTTKTILITSFHVLVSRNIIATTFTDLLLKAGFNVVVIVPKRKEAYFREKFGTRLVVEGVENKLNRLDDFFKDIALAAIRTRALSIMRSRNMGMERPIFQKIFFFAPLIKKMIPFLYRVCMPKNAFGRLFEKYAPVGVFATDVFSTNDCRLMLEARTRKVPVVGMVRSWDNLTTKGGFRVVPDVLITQNLIAQQEAIQIHGIDKDIIQPVGIPHYDGYLVDIKKEIDIGIPTGKKFVVYAPLGDRIMKVGDRTHKHSFDSDLILFLDENLPKEVYLLVRLPPTDTVTVDRSVLSQRVVFQEPGVRFGEGVKGVRTSEMSPEDDLLLLATLKRASVVINPFSSLCVDAALLNRPIIIPAFDITPVGYVESVQRLQEFEHFQTVIRSGGARVVVNTNELLSALTTYLTDDTTDSAQRKSMATDQVFALDGRSSERLYKVLCRAVE